MLGGRSARSGQSLALLVRCPRGRPSPADHATGRVTAPDGVCGCGRRERLVGVVPTYGTVGTEEAASGEHAATGPGERGAQRWRAAVTGRLPDPCWHRLLATAGVGLVVVAYVRVLHGVARVAGDPTALLAAVGLAAAVGTLFARYPSWRLAALTAAVALTGGGYAYLQSLPPGWTVGAVVVGADVVGVDPETDIERAYERLGYVLTRRRGPRRTGETAQQYLDRVGDEQARRVGQLYTQARPGEAVGDTAADEAASLVREVVRDR